MRRARTASRESQEEVGNASVATQRYENAGFNVRYLLRRRPSPLTVTLCCRQRDAPARSVYKKCPLQEVATKAARQRPRGSCYQCMLPSSPGAGSGIEQRSCAAAKLRPATRNPHESLTYAARR